MRRNFGPFSMTLRPGTSDERVVEEVISRHAYRRTRLGFDVEVGERWLDLGGNIGAFAVYAALRGARWVQSFEPDPTCFALLQQNCPPGFNCIRGAVTAHTTYTIDLFRSARPADHYRQTTVPSPSMIFAGTVPNWPMRTLCKATFDGIKMDIEGAEMAIFDAHLLPRTAKLVVEYHTSRDSSTRGLARRLTWLASRFRHVHAPPEYERILASGASTIKTFHDRCIFCWGPK